MRERGFTLLEVLVATVIAALALAVLFRGAIGGVEAARIATHMEEAVSRARSHLATLEHGPLPQPGMRSGDDGGGFRWHTAITRVSAAAGLALYDESIAISWRTDGGRREVVLHGRRLAHAPQEAP